MATGTPPTTHGVWDLSLPPSFSLFFPFPRLFILGPVQPVAESLLLSLLRRA